MTEKNRPSTKPTPQEVNDSLALGGEDTGVTMKEAFAMMGNVDTSALEEITGEYLQFDKVGDEKNLLFTGMTTVTIDGKTMEAVRFTDGDNQQFVFAGVVVVGALKKLTQIPCLVRLKYVSDGKSINGTYKNIRVFTFPSNKA